MQGPRDISGSDSSAERLKNQLDELRNKVRTLSDQLQSARDTIARLRQPAATRTAPGRKAERAEKQDLQALAKRLDQQAMILERDNAVARKLQESLRPVWLTEFEGVDLEVYSKSGARVGGDFCDIIKISDTCIGLLIADVTGYGLPAAVMMATARMAFRTFATLASSPKTILEKVNKALLECTLAGHHLTAFLGLLDSEMLTFQYVNASHCPPYLLRKGSAVPLDTDGLFVGVFEDPQYEQKCIQLERNDRLFLFTDGLLRGLTGGEKQTAVARLQQCLYERSDLPVRDLVHQISGQIAEEPGDDAVILALELLRLRARKKTITIASIPSELSRVEDTVLPALAAKGYGERALFAVKLALEESIINAIKHGNQLDSTKRVTIEFRLDDDKTVVSVEDEGEGFDPASVPDPTTDEHLEDFSGRGLVLMRAYMDSVKFNEKGNKVTMIKYAPWHQKKPSG